MPISGDLDRFALVTVKKDRRGAGVLQGGLGPEDPRVLWVEESRRDQFLDPAAGGEAGVEAQPWVWPLHPAGRLLGDDIGDPVIACADEPFGERLVVGDQPPMHLECVHLRLPVPIDRIPCLWPLRSYRRGAT